jgi:dihydroorotate dehydrogenase
VSSPNTPGLRDLQAIDRLRPLLVAVRRALTDAAGDVPLLVKIAPDLSDDDVDAVADLALELGLDGIVATNTTVRRDGLRTGPDAVAAAGAGGLSGAPLRERSLEVLRRLRARTDGRLLLVAAGGIETGEDAWERVLAGATLLQAYTGFVYGGPGWPRRVQRDLARRAREAGYDKVQDAVGAGVPPLQAGGRRRPSAARRASGSVPVSAPGWPTASRRVSPRVSTRFELPHRRRSSRARCAAVEGASSRTTPWTRPSGRTTPRRSPAP